MFTTRKIRLFKEDKKLAHLLFNTRYTYLGGTFFLALMISALSLNLFFNPLTSITVTKLLGSVLRRNLPKLSFGGWVTALFDRFKPTDNSLTHWFMEHWLLLSVTTGLASAVSGVLGVVMFFSCAEVESAASWKVNITCILFITLSRIQPILCFKKHSIKNYDSVFWVKMPFLPKLNKINLSSFVVKRSRF